MEDHYGMPDLRQYINGRSHFPVIPPPPDHLFSSHRNITPPQPHHHHPTSFNMLMVGPPPPPQTVPSGLYHHDFRSDSTTDTTAAAATSVEVEGGGCLGVDGGGTGRWPRQETLTLLEVRSKLDSKFKEANQKGPLWDDVSRIMCEEHGYQRSGKKCREKFENLYKYYKKTKEGKAGRQDGKHYRFFRQLEALYGDNTNPHQISLSETTHLLGNSFQLHNSLNTTTEANQTPFQAPKLCDNNSLSLSNSEFHSSSSSSDDSSKNKKKKKKKRGRRSWKGKIIDFIDSQMRKLMEKQEEWLEKVMKTIEKKELERALREEEWRKQERERVEREHKFWASERAWIEARDSALTEALHKLTGKEGKASSSSEVVLMGTEIENENGSETITHTLKNESWQETEITKLIELRTSMDSRFEQSGCSEEVVWEEIAAKMGCFGYDRSGLMCKDKWDMKNNYLIRKTNKKHKENSIRSCFYLQNNESMYNINQVGGGGGAYCEINEQGPVGPSEGASSPPSSNARNTAVHESCFRFLVGADQGGNLWENYGVKLINKGSRE